MEINDNVTLSAEQLDFIRENGYISLNEWRFERKDSPRLKKEYRGKVFKNKEEVGWVHMKKLLY